jgi:surface antigen
MKLEKIILILVISLSLGACSTKHQDVNNTKGFKFNRSHLGAVVGGTTGAMTCVELLSQDPYVAAACAVVGAFAGAELLYASDYDLHNAVFVDHLNNGPGSASYSNWLNSKTGSNGTIKINRSYAQGPIICKEYESSFNIKNSWPVVGIANNDIDTRFGVVCQMPDGRWVEKR